MKLWILQLMRDAAYVRHALLVRMTSPISHWDKEDRQHRKFVDDVYLPYMRMSRSVSYE